MYSFFGTGWPMSTTLFTAVFIVICLYGKRNHAKSWSSVHMLVVLSASLVTILLLALCGQWHLPMSANTVAWWTLCVFFALLWERNRDHDRYFFTQNYLHLFALTTVTTFITGFPQLPAAWQLLLNIPAIGGLIIICRSNDGEADDFTVKTFLLMGGCGLVLTVASLGYVICSRAPLPSLLLAPLFTLAYCPFLFLSGLFAVYQAAFVKAGKIMPVHLQWYAMARLLLTFHIKPIPVARFSEHAGKVKPSGAGEIDHIISDIAAGLPIPELPIPEGDRGWCYEQVNTYLEQYEGYIYYYQTPANKPIRPSFVAPVYEVTGDRSTATLLTVSIAPAPSTNQWWLYLLCCQELFEKAMNKQLPPGLIAALKSGASWQERLGDVAIMFGKTEKGWLFRMEYLQKV